MTAEELLRSGMLDDAMTALKEEVRNNASDAKPRVFLFQLFSVMGDWERALTQLNVACDLDANNLLMAQVCRQLLACEALRADVFAGKKSPVIFGEPEEWMSWLVQSSRHVANEEWDAAEELRNRAFEAAPATPGTFNDQAFEWICDGDTRLGPMIEAVIEGKYYWVPYQHIRSLRVEPPKDLRDLVWTPATFRWTNGGEAIAFIPVRYPGSESRDNPIRLGRETHWEEKAGGTYLGIGQRLLATDAGEFPILEAASVLIGDQGEPEAEELDGEEAPETNDG